MRLLLIRHGETVDNVAGRYAGVRDSPLTTHGVLQASRLANHVKQFKVTRIFSSDLQRAFKTAEAIRIAQAEPLKETVKLKALREQDFGALEGKSYLPKADDNSGKEAYRETHTKEEGFQDVESRESMKARVKNFVDVHLTKHLGYRGEEHLKEITVIVAHGIILSHLWREILERFAGNGNSRVELDCPFNGHRGLEHLGGWSNTGYLDLMVKPSRPIDTDAVGQAKIQPEEIPLGQPPTYEPSNLDMTLVIKGVDCKEHLRGLKRTRGGIGSAKHDDKQKTVDSFFKKRKIG